MADIVPTPGRIVWYMLNADDARKIGDRRRIAIPAWEGNHARLGDIYPAMVVRVWGDTPDSAVNLKVELDGSDSYWATSRYAGKVPGTYQNAT